MEIMTFYSIEVFHACEWRLVLSPKRIENNFIEDERFHPDLGFCIYY